MVFYSALIVILFLTTLISSSAAFFPIKQDNKTHYVSGAEIVNLSSPLFYHTFVPIIYEISLPSWNLTDMNIEWPANYSNDCELSDAWADNWTNYACPVAHHMKQVTHHFFQGIKDWTSINSTQKTQPVNLYSCHKIISHFKSYSVGHEEKDEYLFEDLKNCPLGQIVYERLVTQEVNTSVYNTMLLRFMDENTNPYKYRITGYAKYATGTNAYASLQIAELLDYVYASSKWSQAISTCDRKRIPYTLISKETLGTSLREIERTLSSKDNYRLTIDSDDFSTYFKLPLVDCAFTTKNSLLVRILVPVKKIAYNYKLSSVNPIPFLRSIGNLSEICEYEITKEKFIIEEETGMTIHKECTSGELCLIPDIANRPVMDYCVGELVKNYTEGIMQHCKIKCEHLDTKHLPHFRQLSSDKYVVLGRSTIDIFVSCDAQPYKVLNPPMSIGAWEVTLPCQCQLVYHREALYSMTPCGKELLIREIMPVLWSSEETFSLASVVDKDDEGDVGNNIASDSSDIVPLLILSFFVILLFCLNILLIFLVTRLYKRVCKVELSNAQRLDNSMTMACNFYETPMFVRANDD